VQVGVRGERHLNVMLVGARAHRAQVPADVDHERAAVAEVDQVGAVAQPFVDQGQDRRCSHVVSYSAAEAGLRPMTSTYPR